jgi:hypothetical protein
LFVLAARFKRPSLAKPQTDEATGADRSNLFRQRTTRQCVCRRSAFLNCRGRILKDFAPYAALRLRARSPAGIPLAVFANRTFVPRAQLRARLPKGDAKAAACRTHRQGYSDAPRAPVVLPAGMIPEPPGCGLYPSARGRRTRSAAREYPRPTASFNERDWRRLLSSFPASQRR